MFFDPAAYTVTTSKPLPVCLLLDVSGSMSGSKISNLNRAVKEMLHAFAEEEKMEAEILVSIITFGSNVKLHLPFTKASQVRWEDMTADGGTPMGTALAMAKEMIEDKETTPSRAYRPTVILVSDGQPTDRFDKPLSDFVSNGRSSKCFCLALAIGGDADETMLNRFIAKTPLLAKNTPNRVLHAEDASQISELFQRFTMSVTMRNRSTNPNEVPAVDSVKLDGGTVRPGAAEPTNGKAAAADQGYW